MSSPIFAKLHVKNVLKNTCEQRTVRPETEGELLDYQSNRSVTSQCPHLCDLEFCFVSFCWYLYCLFSGLSCSLFVFWDTLLWEGKMMFSWCVSCKCLSCFHQLLQQRKEVDFWWFCLFAFSRYLSMFLFESGKEFFKIFSWRVFAVLVSHAMNKVMHKLDIKAIREWQPSHQTLVISKWKCSGFVDGFSIQELGVALDILVCKHSLFGVKTWRFTFSREICN